MFRSTHNLESLMQERQDGAGLSRRLTEELDQAARPRVATSVSNAPPTVDLVFYRLPAYDDVESDGATDNQVKEAGPSQGTLTLSAR